MRNKFIVLSAVTFCISIIFLAWLIAIYIGENAPRPDPIIDETGAEIPPLVFLDTTNNLVLPFLISVGGLLSTLTTIALGWRTDRRQAVESELKSRELELKIKEMELKLLQATKPAAGS
ncbi:hypothetical protein [uncultured Roseibium sp.]|uniref:hypothetical protein n=1 Tax=uncultured Roseibium sp. TaxID=1936171 RepID=UPI00262778FD|nr:hypothetical protein [uncultured Roseibium sp.]